MKAIKLNGIMKLSIGVDKMKKIFIKCIEIFTGSINYIIISYALSNMAMFFKTNLLYILFFASEIWVAGNYLKNIFSITKIKLVSVVFLIICFIIHISMIYFTGYISGTIIPFSE